MIFILHVVRNDIVRTEWKRLIGGGNNNEVVSDVQKGKRYSDAQPLSLIKLHNNRLVVRLVLHYPFYLQVNMRRT